jgi:hypothetical protein
VKDDGEAATHWRNAEGVQCRHGSEEVRDQRDVVHRGRRPKTQCIRPWKEEREHGEGERMWKLDTQGAKDDEEGQRCEAA